MSKPPLPAELLDHVVDHLHDSEDALKNCCLVSKSWIPRARRHLFADVQLDTEALKSWKEMFPDSSVSPGHYTKTLLIEVDYSRIVTAADVEAGGWLRGFSRVLHLEVDTQSPYSHESWSPLVPLHGLSPVVKSLRVGSVALSASEIFNFILSFPLLEDLAARCGSDGPPTIVHPSNPPKFTGSLELMTNGMVLIARRLLSLPGGIHFRKLVLRWTQDEDILLASALVERCFHTLESLDITCYSSGTPIQRLSP